MILSWDDPDEHLLFLCQNVDEYGVSSLRVSLITLISWALIRMFVGVAQDIKAIRAKVESS